MDRLAPMNPGPLRPAQTKPLVGVVQDLCAVAFATHGLATAVAGSTIKRVGSRSWRAVLFVSLGSLVAIGNAQEIAPSPVCPQPSGSQPISEPPVNTDAESTHKSEGKPDGSGNSKAPAEADAFRALLTESFTANWLFFPSDPAAPSVWSLRKEPTGGTDGSQELVLVCSGAVKGFAYTKEKFGDFELKLEWRFPNDDSGNSGVLLFTQSEPRIWPTSLQLQLHQPTAGSLIPSGDSKAETIQDAEVSLARPIGQWNECRIVCVGGTVTVEINGKKAGQATGVTPNSGSIAIQSEGSEVHFRGIRIRPLPSPATTSSAPSTSSADSRPEPKQ